jgi:hypothetical protein
MVEALAITDPLTAHPRRRAKAAYVRAQLLPMTITP